MFSGDDPFGKPGADDAEPETVGFDAARSAADQAWVVADLRAEAATIEAVRAAAAASYREARRKHRIDNKLARRCAARLGW